MNTRLRRLRRSEPLRSLVRETTLAASDLILPLFVCPGERVKREVSSMPGVFNLSVDQLLFEAEACLEAGLGGVILFGIPEEKDAEGTGAWIDDGIVQEAVRAVKSRFPELLVLTDVCLCEYTDHGHCGVIQNNEVQNDPTLKLLARVAVSHAEAGADIVAPSDMMDGRVGAIRQALDESNFSQTPILSYAVKYASAFYGPFRDAAGSTPQFGDRRGYQMDPANRREALREIELDLSEGADMLMVKPGLPYLDILRDVRESCDVPLGAYCVSGEYAMLKAAARNGWLDERRATLEALTCLRRAGADFILTYHARAAADWLRE
jgi:porphobilinogen synthase